MCKSAEAPVCESCPFLVTIRYMLIAVHRQGLVQSLVDRYQFRLADRVWEGDAKPYLYTLIQESILSYWVWGEFRPPYKFWAKSVRIFSNAHRQLGNVFVGSPSARARQPILSANWNFLSLPRYCGAGQKRASRIFIFNF